LILSKLRKRHLIITIEENRMKKLSPLVFSFLLSSPVHAFTYVALGDSITSGLNSEPWSLLGQYSWATGWDLDRPFAKEIGADKYYNVALPGAITEVVDYQVSFTKLVKADYVTFIAGTNDVCWGLGHLTVNHVRDLIEKLSKQENVKKILVGTLPDLQQVYDLRRESKACELTKIFCPNFFLGTEEYRAGVSRQIRDINEAFKRLEYDFPKVLAVDSLNDNVYHQDDISTVDCFHPSKIGQQRIADLFSATFKKEVAAGL